MYALGIDLGTTYTAAATWRGGQVEMASLGSRSAAVPSVVLRHDDEGFLIGDAAVRRGLVQPDRLSREFKRRLGDTVPILLGGVPFSAEALMARLLHAVVAEVAAREGGQPAAICISHPANWGRYKTDLLTQAARLADLAPPVGLTTEPEAAAVFYAHQQRVPSGAIVAVYDLGGGTFDAAVLRKQDTGFTILGQPEGIERLGGIDVDAAVFAHVGRALGDALSELDEDDPQVVVAVARLRQECVEAKEALSDDTDTTIPVLLPNLSTEVRLTRAELEEMVRPALLDSVAALRRALASAGVTPEELHSVLLVGGSSRMPIVAQLVGAELGRPVAVDAHPKHAVAAGAAWTASGTLAIPPVVGTARVPVSASGPTTATTAAPATTATTAAPATTATTAAPATTATTAAPATTGGDAPSPAAGRASRQRWPRVPWWQWGGAAAAVVLLIAGGVALALSDGGPGGGGPGDGRLNAGGAALPAEEECTDEIRSNERWICLTSASFDAAGNLVVQYDAEWGGGDNPNISTGFHMHLYGGDGAAPPAEIMGFQVPDPGTWQIADGDPAIVPVDRVDSVIGTAPKVCARISDNRHHLVRDRTGGYETGNCITIDR
jgi:molecular chaperone DnaK